MIIKQKGGILIPNSSNNINIIIDRNNEDHCGCCFVDTTQSTKQVNTVNSIEVSEDYYLPYII